MAGKPGMKRKPKDATVAKKPEKIRTKDMTDVKLEEIAVKAAKQVYGVPPHPGTNPSIEFNPDIKRADIKRILGEVLYWYDRKIVKTDDECAERLNEFFERITTTGEIPTWEKLCLSLGATNEIVKRWENGEQGDCRSKMIKQAKQIMASMDANLVSENKIPQVTYIFRSKNFYGMRDQAEVVITPNNKIEGQSIEDVQKKYLEATVVEEPKQLGSGD